MEVDIRDFTAAMNFVVQETGKDSAEILNRAGLHIVIGGKGVKGVIQRTPRAERARIQSVSEVDIAKTVMKKAKSKGIRMTLSQRRKAVKKERARRMSAIAYTGGPGWDKAARAMGGKGVKRQSGFEKSDAAKGSGTKATPTSLVAEIINTAPAGEEIGYAALVGAIDDVATDMVSHAAKKYGNTFAKVSR